MVLLGGGGHWEVGLIRENRSLGNYGNFCLVLHPLLTLFTSYLPQSEQAVLHHTFLAMVCSLPYAQSDGGSHHFGSETVNQNKPFLPYFLRYFVIAMESLTDTWHNFIFPNSVALWFTTHRSRGLTVYLSYNHYLQQL
jgi:hypothetical protein